MEQVTIKITTQAPTIIAESFTAGVLTATQDYISGRVLRGIFANEFIKSHNLGKEAHKNELFMELFYKDLRFVSAYKSTPIGAAIPAPRSLQKNKNSSAFDNEKAVVDFYYAHREFAYTTDETSIEKKNLLGFKGVKGFVAIKDGNCYPVQVKTAIKLHMSRSSAQERVQGRSQDGNIFNYEYIEPGEVFEGTVVGERAMLERFVREFPKHMTAHIGRSRRTEYGQCHIEIGDIKPIDTISLVSGDTSIYIRLQTPLIVDTHYSGGHCSGEHIATDSPLINTFADALESNGFQGVSFGPMYVAYQEEQNFNSIWGVRSSSVAAVSAGSTIELKKETPWTREELDILQDVLHRGVGLRVQEGYGQCRFWIPGEFEMADWAEFDTAPVSLPTTLHCETQRIARHILEKKLIIEARMLAARDMRSIVQSMKAKGITKHFTTILLEQLGSTRHDGIDNLKRFIDEIKDSDMVMPKNLRQLFIGQTYASTSTADVNLMEYISSFDASILVDTCVTRFAHTHHAKDLMNLANVDMQHLANELVFEYWTYFLRHIRKA